MCLIVYKNNMSFKNHNEDPLNQKLSHIYLCIIKNMLAKISQLYLLLSLLRSLFFSFKPLEYTYNLPGLNLF